MTDITVNLSYRNPETDALESNPITPPGVTMIAYANWTDGNITPTSIYPGVDWGVFEDVPIVVESGALKFSYPAANKQPKLNLNVPSININEIFIEFDARMPGNKFGCKFVKCHGKVIGGNNYSNTTFGLDYTGVDFGSLYQIQYGDGAITENDNNNYIGVGSGVGSLPGRSPSPVITADHVGRFASSQWGTDWHHFKIHIKYNSGTSSGDEVPNGEYYLEIDDVMYVHATDLFNRNPANSTIDYIEFGGLTQGATDPFELYLDNIVASIGGFMS
jgi:hypothetical protein